MDCGIPGNIGPRDSLASPLPSAARPAWPDDRILLIGRWVLVLSFGLRAILAYRGGQMFWPDEGRFETSRLAARFLLDGQFRDAADALFSQSDHLLFKLASLLPASVEIATDAPAWVPALFFAAVSTWVIWLVERVARAAGATAREGLVALILAASSSSLFYYSRHYVPYDLSLGFLLLALVTGLPAVSSRRASILSGVWAGLGFLAYNGYWSLAAVILITHALRAFPSIRAVGKRSFHSGLGLLLPVLVVLGVGRLLGHDLFSHSIQFAGTVTQGDLGFARKFVPQYLWAADHGLAVLWAVGIVAALILGLSSPRLRHLLLWALFSLLLCALLVLPSDVFHRFALSARHVRVLVPFLCLATASAVCAIQPSFARRTLLPVLFCLIALQAAYNFAPPLAQIFPPQFQLLAIRTINEARQHDFGPYAVYNWDFLHNPDWAKVGPDRGVTLLRRNHPLEFVPYLYEGYNAETRARFRARDLSMRVVRLDAGGLPLRGYPAGPIELTLRFPEDPLSLLPEPLIATGKPEHGDLLYLIYEGREHIRLGFDHFGSPARVSRPIPLDRSRPHRLQVSMGSFYPAGEDSSLVVKWNEDIIFSRITSFHPAAESEIDVGHNFINATTAVPLLSAEIVAFAPLSRPVDGQRFREPPGALRLQLTAPYALMAGEALPLLSSGPLGKGDLVFLQRDAGDRLRIGYDHMGTDPILSDPFTFEPDTPLSLVIATGSLAPSGHLPAPASARRERLFVSLNGQIALNRGAGFHPSRPEELAVGINTVGSIAAPRGSALQVTSIAEPAPRQYLQALQPHPGTIRLQMRFFGPHVPGRSEPLVSTGLSGAGDLVFIRFEDSGHFRIGCDHWGVMAVWSEPIPYDRSQPLELTISLGSQFPSLDTPFFAEHPHRSLLKNRLFVAVGRTVILNQDAAFHPEIADSCVIGSNPIGASTAGEQLSADILAYDEISPEEILPLLAKD